MVESLGAESEHWCIVLIVVERDGSLALVAEPTRQAVPCPKCGELSGRQHSSYERRPLDLPWRGHTVRLKIHSRRWFCDVPECPRQIFAERFDGVLAHYARRTNGTTELLTTFALQAGGEGGARLARKAGVPISPDTLLRLLHTMIDTRWQTVRERHAAGATIRRIAKDMGMSRMTVRRLLQTPDPPRNRPPERPRPGGLSSPSLQPYRSYLEARWQDGCSNIAQLCREVEALGYQGSRSLLYRVLVPWRGPRPPPDSVTGRRRRGRAPRVRRFNVRWLCLRPPHQLDQHEREALQDVLDNDERLSSGYQLLQRFRRLVVRKNTHDLAEWLEDAQASGLRPFMSLARGIQSDLTAVLNGLRFDWSTGPVEGHVTRTKLFI
jgi:transposase